MSKRYNKILGDDAGKLTCVREIELRYASRRGPRIGRIASSRDLVKLALDLIPCGPREHFIAIALDTKMQAIGYYRVTGSINHCVVDTSDVLRAMLLAGATGYLVAHNHPSGDVIASPDDVALTERLAAAGKLVGVHLYDHVIVGALEDGYFSFLDAGLLPRPERS